MTRPFPIIFTDIDGTLIDFDTYTASETQPIVSRLRERAIPVILCSSKTRREQEYYRRIFNLPDPFIVENGSSVFIPKNTFDFDFPYTREENGYKVIEFGTSAREIHNALAEIRRTTNLTFTGYADLSLVEICKITGLPPEQAESAHQREYSETIVTSFSNAELSHFGVALRPFALQILPGGRFHTITSVHTDKGRAVKTVSALYRQKYGNITTIGLGDSQNDYTLLAAVDHPCLVQTTDGTWQPLPGLEVERIPGAGPVGWRMAVERLIFPHLDRLSPPASTGLPEESGSPSGE